MTGEDWIREVLDPLRVDEHTLRNLGSEARSAARWYTSGAPDWWRLHQSIDNVPLGARNELAAAAVSLYNHQPVLHSIPEAWGLWQQDVDKLSRWLSPDQRHRLLVLIDRVLDTRDPDQIPPGFSHASDGQVRRRNPRYAPRRGDIVQVNTPVGPIGALVTGNQPHRRIVQYVATRKGFPDGRSTPEQSWLDPLTWMHALGRGAILWRTGPLLPGQRPFRTRLRHARGLLRTGL